MANVLMPRTKTWTSDDGVTIEYLTYDTMLKSRVNLVLREAYQYPAPVEGYPDRKEVPTAVYIFYTAMPCIVSVVTPEVAPDWALMLKTCIESRSWLNDPVSDFEQIERYAPEKLLLTAYAGFKETRETAYVAPPELQAPAPLPPEAYGIDGEAVQNAENPTLSSTDSGTRSTPTMSLVKPARRQAALSQKAT